MHPNLLQLLMVEWRQIIFTALLSMLGFTTYAFLLPKWYEAELVVVQASSPKAGSLAHLGADLPIDLPMTNSDTERIQAVLRSRSVTDAIIKKFDLTSRYEMPLIEATRDTLWQHCSTKVEKKAATVAVTCEDQDPQMAMAMAHYFGEVGNQVFQRVSAAAAREESAFLEKRVAEARRDVNEASARLRAFEEKHNIIDLAEQSKAVVSAMATLKGEELSKEIELGYLNSFSSADEATAVQLRKQLAVMSSKMKSLTGNTKGSKDDSALFPPVASVPKFKYELAELYRQQKTQEALFLLLNQRYESAKTNVARDISTFQVLDEPAYPTRKSRPKRAKLIMIGLAVGALLGAGRIIMKAQLSMMLNANKHNL